MKFLVITCALFFSSCVQRPTNTTPHSNMTDTVVGDIKITTGEINDTIIDIKDN